MTASHEQTLQVVLHVRHGGESKMVGKVFPSTTFFAFPDTEDRSHLVFLHEATSTQWHRNLNAPGGLDFIVWEWLLDHQVVEVAHYETDTHRFLVAPIDAFLSAEEGGDAIRQISGGRDRLYLSMASGRWSQYQGNPYPKVWIASTNMIELGE